MCRAPPQCSHHTLQKGTPLFVDDSSLDPTRVATEHMTQRHTTSCATPRTLRALQSQAQVAQPLVDG
jgi:hypothetical protein